MAPLEGHTLGQRQRHYNQLLKQAIANKTPLSKINFQEDDVDNMLKIDIACAQRNVTYILKVFKCDDMLYVSRAIKKSTWLITDNQYAHIIEPKYLHHDVFPQMNAKAVTKLMLNIRRHIKDEVLAEAFYNYVYKKNRNAALSWLEKCSIEFIESVIRARADELPLKVIKRLCRKSFNVFRIYLHQESYRCHLHIYNATKYYLKRRETAGEFLDIVRSSHYLQYLQFNEKYTKILIQNCAGTLIKEISSLFESIHLPTFIKFVEKDGIKKFILSKGRSGFDVLPFLKNLPREDTLDVLRTLYNVDIKESVDSGKGKSDAEALFYAIVGPVRNLSEIYRWYEIAPFDVAFRDLKKFVFSSSSAEERHSILIVLLTCANYDFEHVKTVLQYYHDKHINEPYVHKNTFVKSLLLQQDTFRFDDSTWNILNALFHSLEVYIPSTNRVQECIISIIIHSIINDLPVNEVVEEKFEISTLKDVKRKLNHQEQEKVFNYLNKLLMSKISKQRVDSETGMREAIRLVKILWELLKHWNKVTEHHQFVIGKIAELSTVNNNSSWIGEMQKNLRKRRKKNFTSYRQTRSQNHSEAYINLPSIYAMLNSYKKLLFERSIMLHASEETCLNALKHDPELLTRYKNEINTLRCDDEISLHRLLRKFRIYWPASWATEWAETNISLLENATGHRALVRGIVTLLPRDKLIDFIKMHAPKDSKMSWSDDNRNESSVQKHIAKNMHIARPQLAPEVVLWYAKGDYLQYAHSSLNTMYHNLRPSENDKYIRIMLKAPVSLQKHGIRLAFAKFKTDEILKVTAHIWSTTSNSSIRAVIFKMAFDLLCKEKEVMQIEAIWATVSSFIDDLNQDENEIVYSSLSKVCDAPLSIVGDLYQKAYTFFETLPPKPGYERSIDRILDHAADFIEYLDSDFVENKLLDSLYSKITCNDNSLRRIYLNILSCYLLHSKDSKIQMQKYNTLLRPIINEFIPKWVEGETDLLSDLDDLLSEMCHGMPKYVFSMQMAFPIEILEDILIRGLQNLCLKEHLNTIRRWQITISYMERLLYMKNESKEAYSWNYIRANSLKHLAGICADSIAADETLFFPSIFLPYIDILNQVFKYFNIDTEELLDILYRMLTWKYTSIYLVVLEMVNVTCCYKPNEKKEAIKRKIYLYGKLKSEEVALHYFRKFSVKYSGNENDIDDDDDVDDDDDDVLSIEDDYDSNNDSQNYESTDSDQDESQNEELTKTNESQNNVRSIRLCNIM